MLANTLVSSHLNKGGWLGLGGSSSLETLRKSFGIPVADNFVLLVCVFVDPYFLKNKISRCISVFFFTIMGASLQLPYLCYCFLLCH